MSKSVSPIRAYEPVLDLLVAFKIALLSILAGALFTAVIRARYHHRFDVAFSWQGILDLPAGLALIVSVIWEPVLPLSWLPLVRRGSQSGQHLAMCFLTSRVCLCLSFSAGPLRAWLYGLEGR